jgi:small subunit ribosomal protein S6
LATPQTREYELVLMLDPEIPDERREQIASEARKRIEADGNLKHDTAWGMRKLAYEIRQRTEADYRFFRFETGGGLLDDLNHNLRIADGVLRFRIFKVDPGSPAVVPPPPLSASSQSRGPRREQRSRGRDARAERPEPTESETAEAEQPQTEDAGGPAETSAEPSAELSPEEATAGDAAGEAPEPQQPAS